MKLYAGMIVNVYDDGKLGRHVKAKILKHKGKRILIQILQTNPIPFALGDTPEVMWYRRVRRKQGGSFCSVRDNFWFYPVREKEKFYNEVKELLIPQAYEKLTSHRR